MARAAKPRVSSRRAQRAGERSGTRNESLQGRHCFFRQRVRPRTQHSDWLKMTAPVILSHYDTNQRVGGDQNLSFNLSIIFQLFATAMTVKKVHEGHHSDTVVLVVSPLTSIIQKGNSLGLDCAALKDGKDLSSVVSGTTRVFFASPEEVVVALIEQES